MTALVTQTSHALLRKTETDNIVSAAESASGQGVWYPFWTHIPLHLSDVTAVWLKHIAASLAIGSLCNQPVTVQTKVFLCNCFKGWELHGGPSLVLWKKFCCVQINISVRHQTAYRGIRLIATQYFTYRTGKPFYFSAHCPLVDHK